jgi:tripartite ATP-independent transporter DctM subunit
VLPLEWPFVLLFILGGLLVVMATGLPVAFCFMLINIVGAVILWGGATGLQQLSLNMWESVCTFSLLPIPMFVLMGELMFLSGMGYRMLDAVNKWFGRLPGRLALLAVVTATIFSVMSGSTTGTTAMLGTLLVPEMERRGYKKPISIGSVMGSGGLAMLIPPSALAILLASLAGISIAKLLIAGIVPGLIIACFYGSYIVGRCYLQPSMAPSYQVIPSSLREKMVATVKYALPVGFIIFLVLGLIFLGVATPSEAAALGALGTVLIAFMYGGLTREVFKKSLTATMEITVMILIIITGSKAFSQILAFTGATQSLLHFMLSLPLSPILLIIATQLILLFLGCFMSAVPMMMITLPIFMPLVNALGFDPIWFGLLFLINIEMGQTTPPFGLLLFVMKGVAPQGTTMGDIYKAGIPFLLCDLMVMGLVLAYPIIALWLPDLML